MSTREEYLHNGGLAITGALSFLQHANVPAAVLDKLLEAKRDVNRELAKTADANPASRLTRPPA